MAPPTRRAGLERVPEARYCRVLLVEPRSSILSGVPVKKSASIVGGELLPHRHRPARPPAAERGERDGVEGKPVSAGFSNVANDRGLGCPRLAKLGARQERPSTPLLCCSARRTKSARSCPYHRGSGRTRSRAGDLRERISGTPVVERDQPSCSPTGARGAYFPQEGRRRVDGRSRRRHGGSGGLCAGNSSRERLISVIASFQVLSRRFVGSHGHWSTHRWCALRGPVPWPGAHPLSPEVRHGKRLPTAQKRQRFAKGEQEKETPPDVMNGRMRHGGRADAPERGTCGPEPAARP